MYSTNCLFYTFTTIDVPHPWFEVTEKKKERKRKEGAVFVVFLLL